MNDNGAVAATILGFACVILGIVLAIYVLFLLTLQRSLNSCSPRNRTMEPGMVWLNLIPIFNLYWTFHTVINIGNSLKNEFVSRRIDDGGDYGKTLGIWMFAIQIGSSVLSNMGRAAKAAPIELFGSVASIAGLVLFVVYWVRIYGYGNQLRSDDQYRDDRDDTDDDDRPRRPLGNSQSTDIQSKVRDDRIQ